MTKKRDSKKKPSQKPVLSLVVPFPEEKVVIDRSVENLLRRARRAKLSQAVVLGYKEDGSVFVSTNGLPKKDALWLLELLKLDLFDLLEWYEDSEKE